MANFITVLEQGFDHQRPSLEPICDMGPTRKFESGPFPRGNLKGGPTWAIFLVG